MLPHQSFLIIRWSVECFTVSNSTKPSPRFSLLYLVAVARKHSSILCSMHAEGALGTSGRMNSSSQCHRVSDQPLHSPRCSLSPCSPYHRLWFSHHILISNRAKFLYYNGLCRSALYYQGLCSITGPMLLMSLSPSLLCFVLRVRQPFHSLPLMTYIRCADRSSCFDAFWDYNFAQKIHVCSNCQR